MADLAATTKITSIVTSNRVVSSDATTHGGNGVMILRKRKADSLGRVQAAASGVAAGNDVVVSQRHDDHDNDKRQRTLPFQGDDEVANTSSSSSSGGRGSIVGWTTCPLCGKYSKKRYALGRGIANHLHAIHTPWNPSKMQVKIRRRQLEESKRQDKGQQEEEKREIKLESWEPSQQEIDDWDSKVLSILRQVEQEQQQQQDQHQTKGATAPDASKKQQQECDTTIERNAANVGYDRSGQNKVDTYRQSLPPFLQAAANGDFNTLQSMINEAIRSQEAEKSTREIYCNNNNSADSVNGPRDDSSSHCYNPVQQLLDTTDRHMSTAEHWAAGGGHLDCLKFLMDMRLEYMQNNNGNRQHASKIGNKNNKKKKLGRRDGKTCLHYAARNGQLECIQYLLHECKYFLQQEQNEEHGRDSEPHNNDTSNDNDDRSTSRRSIISKKINERSGDGTTSFHMACYGGHPKVIRYLIELGAKVNECNDWGCSSAHWIAMTISTNRSNICECCQILQQSGVNFTTKQSQGHSPLHKAAQKKNPHVIEWMASSTPAAMTNAGKSCDDDDEKLQQPQPAGANLSQEEMIAAGGPDDGGHLPSSIWLSVGGDPSFAKWMKGVSIGW